MTMNTICKMVSVHAVTPCHVRFARPMLCISLVVYTDIQGAIVYTDIQGAIVYTDIQGAIVYTDIQGDTLTYREL